MSTVNKVKLSEERLNKINNPSVIILNNKSFNLGPEPKVSRFYIIDKILDYFKV